MKKLLIADLHLKDTTKDSYPDNQKTFLKEMQNHVIDKIIEIVDKHKPESVDFLGDQTDSANLEGDVLIYYTRLFFEIQRRGISMSIMVGNHTKLNKKDSPYVEYQVEEFLESYGVNLKKYEVDTDNDILYVDHKNIYKLETYRRKHKYLFSHFRFSIGNSCHWDDEIDLTNVLKKFDKIFVGDIHMPIELYDGKLVSINSPLDVAINPKQPDERGVILLDTETGVWERIPTLTNKYRMRTVHYDSVSKFDEDCSRLQEDHLNFYKAKITCLSQEFKVLKSKKYTNIILEIDKPDLKPDEKIKEIKADTAQGLLNSNTSEGFEEACLTHKSIKDRADIEPIIRNALAELERIEEGV